MNIKRTFSGTFSEASLLFAAILLVNAGNYGLNLILGRVLSPAEFAEVSILATGVLILSFIALGFQMTAAKYAALYQNGQNGTLSGFVSWYHKISKFSGLALFVLLLALTLPIQAFLKFNSPWPLFLLCAGIPLYLQMSTGRGILQGRLRFKKLAWSYVSEMVARLILTFGCLFLAIKIFDGYSSEAIAMGFLGSFVASYLISRPKATTETGHRISRVDQKAILAFMGIVGGYECTQILISHSDLILVKHFFTGEEAGLYAAMALIGRIVYFGTWSVVMLLFPKVVQRVKRGEAHHRLFLTSLGIVAGIGSCIVFACAAFPELIVTIFFGDAYVAISGYLWMYALATFLFSVANVFAYYYMSLNAYLPVVFSGLAGIAQIFCIMHFHTSIYEVIIIQLILMTILCTIMVTFHLIKITTYEKAESSAGLSFSTK